MDTLEATLRAAADDAGLAGVVRVDRPDVQPLVIATGHAERAHRVPMRPDTRVAVASGSKGFTALAVMSLVEDDVLDLTTTARSVLGDDLPEIAADVTVEHLLAHRSGIGEYLDDDADVAGYLLDVPVQRLDTTEAFLPLLDGHPTAFPAGERFVYCNGGYVVLALIAERASGTSYHDLVRQRVFARAGMADSDFLRLDELPGDAATGYVQVDGRWRTNVLHLPVLATGDGGAFTTAADMHRFWEAFMSGRIVSPDAVTRMIAPHSDVPDEDARYGLGFWLGKDDDAVELVGYDAGASFRSRHVPSTGVTWSVLSATADGAWPVARAVVAALGRT